VIGGWWLVAGGWGLVVGDGGWWLLQSKNRYIKNRGGLEVGK
jgi:hypothetical protein